MNNYKAVAILVMFACVSCAAAFAQAGIGGGQAAPTVAPTIASVLNRQLSSIERDVMNAADAIPEDKYDWSPASANIPGDFKTPNAVRTTAEQFKHIGDALEAFAGGILGEKRASNADENGPKNVKSKSDVIAYLKASFAKAHSAIETINQQNVVEQIPSPFDPSGKSKTTRLSGAVGMIGHSNNHYGQIIEYMRMNGIVPPESRPRQ